MSRPGRQTGTKYLLAIFYPSSRRYFFRYSQKEDFNIFFVSTPLRRYEVPTRLLRIEIRLYEVPTRLLAISTSRHLK